jgi:hypothetical protein
MSTNFYLHTPEGQKIHLGKRSIGWPFHFRGYPERDVTDYGPWYDQLIAGEIRDEYGNGYTVDEMVAVVEELDRGAWHSLVPFAPNHMAETTIVHHFKFVEFC